jgi:hypothetical protein
MSLWDKQAMADARGATTDLQGHHIEGIARAAQEAGKDGRFSVPLISHIDGNLWTGGCLDGIRLPDDFKFVISLYTSERYALGANTTRLEVKMYDSAEVPDLRQLIDLARIANAFQASGKTLIHCQAGLNRSGLVAALSLMLMGDTPERAIALLRERRCDVVLCNEHFERFLLDFDAELVR